MTLPVVNSDEPPDVSETCTVAEHRADAAVGVLVEDRNGVEARLERRLNQLPREGQELPPGALLPVTLAFDGLHNWLLLWGPPVGRGLGAGSGAAPAGDM